MKTMIVNYIRTRPYFVHGVVLYLVAVLGTVAAVMDGSVGRFIIVSSILFVIASRLIIQQPSKAVWFVSLLPILCAFIFIVMAVLGYNLVASELYSAALLENGFVAFNLSILLAALDWLTKHILRFAAAHRRLDPQPSINN